VRGSPLEWRVEYQRDTTLSLPTAASTPTAWPDQGKDSDLRRQSDPHLKKLALKLFIHNKMFY